MSMDLTFLSNSYMQQILHRMREAEYAKKQQSPGSGTGFGDILSAKDDKNPGNVSADSRKEEESKTNTPPVMRRDGAENVSEIARRWAQETQAYYNRKQAANTSSDLFGEQQILNGRGIDWLSLLGYGGLL